jgi:hypothetical protein
MPFVARPQERAARVCSPPPLRSGGAPKPPKGLRSLRHPVPPVAVQGSGPRSPSTRGGLPLAQHRVRPSFLRSFTLRVGPMAVTPSVVPLASPKPIKVAYRRTICWVLRGPCLRAPGLRLPFAPSRPLHPWGVAHLTPRSLHRRRGRMFASLVDRSATPPHLHHAASSEALPSTSCIFPAHRQGIAPSLLGQASRRRAVAPSSRPQALRRPPYRAHWPVSGRSSRYRASWCPDPVKRTGRGRNTPTHDLSRLAGSPLEEAHAPSMRSLPVECTGRSNSASDGRARPKFSTAHEGKRSDPTNRPSLAPLVLQRSAPLDQPTLQARVGSATINR